MKIFSIIALILSTLLVLAWPLCLFITPFLFDHATTDETKIGAFLIAFLGYPAGWIIALISLPLRRLVKSPKKWWESPTPYLFLIPFAHLGVAFVMVAVGFLGR